MKISDHFTLEELLRSDNATHNGYIEQFNPPPSVVSNLTILVQKVLEPLRLKANVAIRISSGYRCERTNLAAGGASDSQHLKGQAADTTAEGYTVEQWYQFIKHSGIPFDQCIQEFDEWVHISYNPFGAERNQCLRAVKENDKTKYIFEQE